MIGFFNTSTTFSLAAIQTLQSSANTLYITEQDWTPSPNPTTPYDVTDATAMAFFGETPLVADGTTDDTDALNTIAQNTSITNWYIPEGKTIKVSNVGTQPHLTHIFGGGSVISINTQEQWYNSEIDPTTGEPYGWTWSANYSRSFVVGNDVDAGNSVVFDGLTFLVDSATYRGGLYGSHIAYNRFNSSNFTEIRNCTLYGMGRTSDIVAIRTDWDAILEHTNIKIYNNDFIQAGHFSIEVGDQRFFELQSEEMAAVAGLEIFNNYFDGRNQASYYQGISLVRLRKNNNILVYNNKFEECDWGIELATCDNVRVYNNEIIGSSNAAIIANGSHISDDYSDDAVVTGKNFIYYNHIGDGEDYTEEYPFINLYYGNRDEWSNNFISSRIRYYYNDSGNGNDPYYGSDWHDNIIIDQLDTANYVLKFLYCSIKNPQDFRFVDNDVYGMRDSSQVGLDLLSGSTNMELSGNNFYLLNGTACITNGFTQTGGSCDLSWDEVTPNTLPTGKTGAGLLDPNNIGPQ